ncbi:MAG: arylsulfatase [Pseudomonadota bacterium]
MTEPSDPQIRTYPGFDGVVGRTREESTPAWVPPVRARPGSPNIVVIYLDDMGYSDLGCYGSEIATPHIDAIAERGLRFNHYTTHPICSSARAALLTGCNAHAVATGWLSNNNPGFPGYFGDIPFEAATLPEVLRDAGYATIGVGKWHNSNNSTVPNASWPTGRGFERFYGFLEGETSFFHPARLMLNNMVLPIDNYPEGYYSTDDWTDQSVRFIKEIRHDEPQRPFFLYLAHNAMHSPLQAKPGDIAKYHGRYDAGWDVIRQQRLDKQKALGLVPADTRLPPGDLTVPAWDSLPAEHRTLFARHMETYAGMLDCVDQNTGRLVALIDALGELDNTIFIVSSDNGGTSAAGPEGEVNSNRRFSSLPRLPLSASLAEQQHLGSGRVSPLYPSGWAQVSNTPFPTYKTQTGGGGRRVACIASWPARLVAQGQVLSQLAHVTDLMPTLLECAGVAPPTESHGRPALPIQGVSQLPVLTGAQVAPVRTEQYYECWSNRAYYRDGWVAVSIQKLGQTINFDNWTLHRHASDFAEGIDLSAQFPDRLAELVAAFDSDAWANMVYPLDNRDRVQKFQQIPPHQQPPAQGVRRFLPGAQTVNRSRIVPLIADRSYTISVALAHRATDEGVLFSIGDITGGMVLYIEAGLLHCFYNGFGEHHRLEPVPMPPGSHTVAIDYRATGQRRGQGCLLLNGQPASERKDLSPSLMGGFHEGLDIGIDRRGPVDWALFERRGNFRYTGTISVLTIDSRERAPGSRGLDG